MTEDKYNFDAKPKTKPLKDAFDKDGKIISKRFFYWGSTLVCGKSPKDNKDILHSAEYWNWFFWSKREYGYFQPKTIRQ